MLSWPLDTSKSLSLIFPQGLLATSPGHSQRFVAFHVKQRKLGVAWR